MIEDLDLESAVARVTAARFDVCIVGAGAAGIALAVELERQGRRILLLEAGGRQVEPAAQDAYGSEVVGPIPHRGVHEGRVRALGGTTKRWGGQILELGSDDFAPRPWLPGAGWPFGKEQLTDYYGRALDFEGLGGVIPDDLPVWRRLGMAAPTFDGLEQYFSRWCPEPDFAVLHAGVLERSQRLVVLLHANAVSVRLEGEHLREIVCRGTGGTESRFSAGYFVFCLGGIETCRFFLQPLAGQRAPWTHHPALGASFQDHVDAAAAVVRPLDERRFHLLFDNIYLDGYKYHPKVRLAPPLQRRHGTLNVAGTMQFVSDVESGVRAARSVVRRAIRSRGREIGRHDARILLSHLPTVGRQATRYLVRHRAFAPRDAEIRLMVHCEQDPCGASRISLADARDASGMFRTRIDWHVSEHELDTIRYFTEVMRRELGTRGLADVRVGDGTVGQSLRDRCHDANHHMSGMRMATGPRDGLVDPDLLLWGTRNAYVCSAAVFPNSGYSNPTHTLIALALRLADHLGTSGVSR